MKKILFLALTILISACAFSIEDIQRVHLKDAINVALENNVALKSSNLDLNIAKSKAKTQAVAHIDAIQTEIALNQIVAQVNSAKSDVEYAKNKLNKIINASNGIIYDSEDNILSEANNFEEMNTLSPNTEFPKIADFIEVALKNRKDLEIALQKIEVAKAELFLVNKNRIPDLTIGAGYAHQTKNYSDSGATLGGGYVGVAFENIPIFLIIAKQTYKNTIIGYTYTLADYYNSWTNFLREINDEDFEFKILNL